MPPFSFSKVDKIWRKVNKDVPDLLDLKFPSEIARETRVHEVFIVDHDPNLLKFLSDHINQLKLEVKKMECTFTTKLFTTGQECIKALTSQPSIVLLNYDISQEIPESISGEDTLEEIRKTAPHVKVVITSGQKVLLGHKVMVKRGFRDFIRTNSNAMKELEHLFIDQLQAL